MKKVGVIMGSDSDLPVVEKAIDKLKEYGVPYEVHVYSAHRTPVQAGEFARTAQENGFGAIIAAAGKAAHLAGALAANTTLPVIGIPVKSSTLDGLDALLSTVQMPTGIPVATVAIDGAANAALLAIQILAVSDMALAEKIRQARAAESQKVLEKNAGVEAKFNYGHIRNGGMNHGWFLRRYLQPGRGVGCLFWDRLSFALGNPPGRYGCLGPGTGIPAGDP